MEYFFLLPPVAFILFFLIYSGLLAFGKLISAKGKKSENKEKAYACGQLTEENRIQPDYREFFPFAFFFTIMHVLVLVIVTMPPGFYWMGILFIAVVLLSLRILFRR